MKKAKTEIEEEVTVMKKVFYTLGLTVVFNVSGAAQKAANSQEKVSANTEATQSALAGKRSDGSASFTSVTDLQAELQNTLDTKNAKAGDRVVLRTVRTIKQDGHVIITKGAQIIGHVTEVQQRAKNGTASKLGLVFDTLKNGESVTPVSASIVSIASAAVSTSAGDMLDTGLTGSGTNATTASSNNGGGGLLGGVTNTVGGVLNGATQTVGGVTGTAGQTLGGTTSALGQTINELQIATSVNGSAQSSTTLTSPKNNVRLEKGVRISLNVQTSGGN